MTHPTRPGRLIPATAAALLVGGFFCVLMHAVSLRVLGAALLLCASGFVGEASLVRVRRRPADWLPPMRYTVYQRDSRWAAVRWVVAHGRRLQKQFDGIDWVGAWLHIVVAFAGAALVLAMVVGWWRAPSAAGMSALLGGVLVVLAFPLLLLQRMLVTRGASQLEVLLRLPLLTAIVLGTAELIGSLGYQWPALLQRAALLLVGAVAVEVMLRSVVCVFLPVPMVAARRSPAMSRIAAMIRPEWPRAGAVGRAVQREFGIDLSRSWAIAFLLRATLPVCFVMLVFAWLLTGVTVLKLDQRGIYERLGRPVAVESSGLHVHLPWPFGVMRTVELGVVHEIPIVFPAGNDNSGTPVDSIEHIGAEAAPPASVDRLWDDLHPSEASYLIANAADGRQGFQIVNIDLRVVYRTMASDEGAMAATYRVSDAPALIRAAAGRMLVRHFSRYTLNDVLGENREAFAGAFRTELQSRLDGLHAGTEIMAVVVEAIHPPPAAAHAYHNVQAAQINASAQVSQSRGTAFLTLGGAAEESIQARNQASADAAEELGSAQTVQTLFAADHQAYVEGGPSFLTERWMSHLQRDLARAPLLILDHRLSGGEAPTVDLRTFARPDDVPTTNSLK